MKKRPRCWNTGSATKISVSAVDTIPTKHLYCTTCGRACQSISKEVYYGNQ